ncbi:23S rRNA pseudouridine(955/2504/2580) synthase [Terasakiispira papahanaumokuakeensis]|uniref:Pseudouridine synthase n=1 Tax=Terasakiispira papahanaumokuakeensis TaxID=197479 RepID=A0A1E2V8K8_9GAMM|nr:RluA family pseudouridine synthase [Terasakiispira papahanaumokuakeensis]ODC02985.1 23S rRNA pseudouridine(955/2504/2580) synthase [Terasakiispira papahanaumokuakeensis]
MADDHAQVRMVTVTANAADQRLDNFLRTQLKGAPKTLIYRIIRKGEVRVNKKRAKADTRVQIGDLVRIPPIRLSEKAADNPVGEGLKDALRAAIMLETAELMVVNKPHGLAVHGGSGVRTGLIEALRQARPELSFLELVHRLDRDTSGCILLAKSRPALNHLQQQLRDKVMTKRYHAVVLGQWPPQVQTVEVPLKRIERASGERMVEVTSREAGGKWAQTHFRILQRLPGLTLVEAEPVTGRTHQIRVHAQYAGHVLLGDPKYGDEAVNAQYRQAGFGRMYLHARHLRFQDPADDQWRDVEAPIDDNWQRLLVQPPKRSR